jgi:ankyrin repeat protein
LTATELAASAGYLDILQNMQDDSSFETSAQRLHFGAIKRGKVLVVQYLVVDMKEIDINVHDNKSGDTPLSIADSQGYIEIAGAL